MLLHLSSGLFFAEIYNYFCAQVSFSFFMVSYEKL